MAITIQFDPQHCVQQPTLVLATRWGKKLGQLNTVQNFQMTDNLNTASELSFDLYKYYDPALPGENQSEKVKCDLWDEVVDFKLLWCKEWDKWFSLAVTVDDQDATIKNVVGTSLAESQLGQIMLYNIEINTETDILRDDYTLPTILYDPDDPSRSLLNRIMEKAPHYYIKHVDSWLMGMQRTFTFSDISLYDAFQQIAEEIGCLFVFESCSDADDNIDRSISVYDLQSYCPECGCRGDFIDVCPQCGNTNIDKGYGEDTTIFISTDVLANEVTYETNVDAVKNCFRLEAGDDLMTATIINANSNGSAYIWYITDAMKADMPDELVERLNSYDALYNEYQTTKEIDVSGSTLDEYNAIVAKYYANDPEELANKSIESPLIGYPSLSEKLYEILDFYYYLKSELMPTPSTSSTTAVQQAAKLTADNLSPVAVADVSNISLTTANSAVLAMAKVIVSPSYQVKVNESSLTSQIWTGNFTVYSYYDEEDTATSNTISIELNDDFEAYIEQIVEKSLGNSNTDAVSATDLFALDLDDFATALKGYCLDQLTSLNDICQTCMDLLIEQGIADREAYLNAEPNLYQTVYYPYYERKQLLEAALSQRQDQLYVVESMQDRLEQVRADIQQELDFEAYLGTDLWLIFCAYRREDTYSNDNYISDGLNNAQLFSQALQFIDVASEQLYKSATLQHSITATLNNLLSIPGFEPLVDHFSVGNWLRIRVDEQIYRLRMIGYNILWNTIESIDITFSDVTESMTGVSDAKSVLAQASSMASSYGSVSHQASNGNSGYNVIAGWSLSGLDVTNTKIIAAADGQTQTWDEHGFLLRRYDSITDKYDDEQMKIVNSTIAITDDGWKTVRTAIGRFYYQDPTTGQMKQAYGVNGQVLVGNLILGESLGIYTADGSMTFDENGLTIDTSSGNAFTIKNGDDVQFYIDSDGNVVLDNGVKLMWGNIDLADLILSSGNIIAVDDDGNTIYDDDGNPMNIYKYIGAEYAYIENLTTEQINALYGEFEQLVTDYFEANIAYITTLVAETIMADYITTDYIKAIVADVGYLTADSAYITDLTAYVENVYSLLGVTGSFGELQTIHLSTDNAVIEQAVIVEAIAGTILAELVEAEYINTNVITIQSEDGGITIIGNQMQFTNGQIQFYDDDGTLRLQMGQDADGNFTFILYDETGTGIMIDSEGIHESAITDGLIVDRMVDDEANISGYKLNIGEICSIINDDDNSYTITASSITINDQTLDAWYVDITQQLEGLEGLSSEGLTKITTYFALGTSSDDPPCEPGDSGWEDVWSTDRKTATDDTYLWVCYLGDYVDGHQEWSVPYCVTDGYLREETSTMQTQLTVIQGLIDEKVWETDFETYLDPIYGEMTTITENYTELRETVDGLTIQVGQVKSTEAEHYDAMTSQISSITTTVNEISIQVTNVEQSMEQFGYTLDELEEKLDSIEGLESWTPYWCLWDSGTEEPPDDDKLTPAICGEATCGLTICGVTDGILWKEEQPATQDGLYLWVKYLLTYIDGSTEWMGPYCLTDVYTRSQISSAWAYIDVLEDRITEEVGNVQSIVEDNYEYFTAQIASLEITTESITSTVTDLRGEIYDELGNIEDQISSIDGLKNFTPYWCLWDSPTNTPPDDEDLTAAICGIAVCGTTICGVADGILWKVEEPVTQDGLYLWVKFFLEFEDGTTSWSDAYCLTDEYSRKQIEGCYSSIQQLADSITLTVADLTNNLTSQITQTADQINLRVDDLDSWKENLNIGGTQILRGSNDMTTNLGGSSNWVNATWVRINISASGGYANAIDVTDAPNAAITSGVEMYTPSGASSYVSVRQDNVPVTDGENYAMSVYARGTGTLRFQYGNGSYQYVDVDISTSIWKRYCFVFVYDAASTGDTDGTNRFYFGTRSTGSAIQICGMKLEVGTVATDWDECPADISNTMAELKLGIEETQNGVVSYINASADVIKLTGDRISISSDYFTLTTDGYITAAGGTIAGWTIFGNGIYSASASSGEMVVLSPEFISLGSTSVTLDIDGKVEESGSKFRVDKYGYLYSVAGTIGGWMIYGDALASGTGLAYENCVLSPEFIALGCEGLTISTSDPPTVTNPTFYVDKYGEMIATKGTIGGWTISESSLYNSCTSMTDTTTGIYLGIDGLRCYSSSNSQYVNIEKGILTSNAIYAKGSGIYLYDGDDRNGWINGLGDMVTIYSNGSLWLASGDVSIGSSGGTISAATSITANGYLKVDTQYAAFSMYTNSSYYGLYDSDHSRFFVWKSISSSAVGSAGVTGLGNSGTPTQIWGDGVYLNGSSTAITSDRSLKDDIAPLSTKYDDLINCLTPRAYSLKDGKGEKHIGFVVDEVETAMKEAGLDPDDYGITDSFVNPETGETLGAIRYDEMIPILVYEIQTLRERIKALEG